MGIALLGFFGVFLLYPVGIMLQRALGLPGELTLRHFVTLVSTPLQREALANSVLVALGTTTLATLFAWPAAVAMTRYRFPGKGLLGSLLLVPLILPPFVGAIGLKQLLGRFGSLNLALMEIGWMQPDQPVDWLAQGGFLGIVLLQSLNFFPIVYLNLTAALAAIDPSLHEAARNLGANGWRLFRTITLPLILPGYFAGAIIVFIGSFTDLGTPLIFGQTRLVPVQIFDAVADINTNPQGYALVVVVLLLSLALFVVSKRFVGSQRYEMISRGHTADSTQPVSTLGACRLWLGLGGLCVIAMLPHLMVLASSVADRWFFSTLPDGWTARHYTGLLEHPLTASSIRNSLFYSSCSACLDVALGIGIAWILTRTRVRWAGWLDALAMLPLALPGIVIAFGYVAAFDFNISWLNPKQNPTFLLIVSYSVRRLPYVVRATYAGFQQTSVTLEEAAQNLGASAWRTFWTITRPLITANLIAGGLLAFAFAMIEVSDGLILAMRDRFFPITKMIWQTLGRIEPDSPSAACALGVVAMAILGVSLLIATRALGQRLGALFRV